jgi:hypothetical protein
LELKEVINRECRISESADDMAIYVVNRHHRIGVTCVEQNAEAIKKYVGLRGMEIAPSVYCACLTKKNKRKGMGNQPRRNSHYIGPVSKLLKLHTATNLNWE